MAIRCYFCGAETVRRCVNVDERWDGRLVVVQDVPADVCPQCSEVYYPPEAIERLDTLRQRQPAADAVLETPVYRARQLA